jgi:tryptophan 2,3-dioxygenase
MRTVTTLCPLLEAWIAYVMASIGYEHTRIRRGRLDGALRMLRRVQVAGRDLDDDGNPS